MGHTAHRAVGAIIVTLGIAAGSSLAPAIGTPSTGAGGTVVTRTMPTRISYDGVGRYRLGQVVKVRVNPDFYPSCTDSTLLSKQVWMIGTPRSRTSARVEALYVMSPSFRTASGMRVGVSLATLKRTYGANRLVVAREGQSVKGLYGVYQDVAAIKKGKRAITFYLNDKDVVTRIKVSAAAAWGDDEGCA